MIFVLARLFRPYPGYSKVVHNELKTIYSFSSILRAQPDEGAVLAVSIFCENDS